MLDSYYLLPYLTYIKNHQKLFKIYLKNPTDFQHEKVIEQHINEQFLNRYHAKGFTDKKMIRYMIHFYTAGIRRIIYDWVMDDCHDDITYIIKIIHTIIF